MFEITPENEAAYLAKLGVPPEEPPAVTHSTNGHSTFDVTGFMAKHNVAVSRSEPYEGGTRYTLAECVFDPTHKAPDAAVIVRSDGKFGYKCFHASCSGYGWKDFRQKLDPGCYERKNQPTSTASVTAAAMAHQQAVDFRIDWLPGPELLTGDFSIEYLVPGMLARGQSCGIIAPPKCLKTNIAADLATSLAVGGHFLGYFPIPTPCNVGFISVESGLPALQDIFRRVLDASGRTIEDLEGRLFVSVSRPNLANLLHVDEISKSIVTHKLDVLVCDPALPTNGFRRSRR